MRWRDIDLDMLSVSVSQVPYKRGGVCQLKEPKTQHSRRRVAMTPKLALFLREYEASCEVPHLELGMILSPEDFVFTSVMGEPINPSVVAHNFHKLVKQAGLNGVDSATFGIPLPA